MQLAYFKEDGLSQSLTSVPLELFDKAYNWLQKDEYTVKGKVAIIGTSKGCELALLLGSRNKCIATVVALVPAGYVFQGIPTKYHNYNSSSWSYNGQDLPFLPYQGGIKVLIKAIKKDYYGMYEDALKEKSQYPEARIKG
jgi:dienelactone hydrolase